MIDYLKCHRTDDFEMCFKSTAGRTKIILTHDFITFNVLDFDSPTTPQNLRFEDEEDDVCGVEVMFSVKRNEHIDLQLSRELSFMIM